MLDFSLADKVFIIYIISINVITFFVYGYDKRQAKKNKWRVKESTLMLLAFIMGAVGALAAMKTFHHKTLHRKFTIGVPAFLVINAAAAVAWFYFL